ncbi:MAG TPA: flagellar hook-length control protein FliK [Bacteroidota bacterium]|nr:flagellar hook-length control protein FliK [Bacteroidota bacterium]
MISFLENPSSVAAPVARETEGGQMRDTSAAGESSFLSLLAQLFGSLIHLHRRHETNEPPAQVVDGMKGSVPAVNAGDDALQSLTALTAGSGYVQEQAQTAASHGHDAVAVANVGKSVDSISPAIERENPAQIIGEGEAYTPVQYARQQHSDIASGSVERERPSDGTGREKQSGMVEHVTVRRSDKSAPDLSAREINSDAASGGDRVQMPETRSFPAQAESEFLQNVERETVGRPSRVTLHEPENGTTETDDVARFPVEWRVRLTRGTPTPSSEVANTTRELQVVAQNFGRDRTLRSVLHQPEAEIVSEPTVVVDLKAEHIAAPVTLASHHSSRGADGFNEHAKDTQPAETKVADDRMINWTKVRQELIERSAPDEQSAKILDKQASPERLGIRDPLVQQIARMAGDPGVVDVEAARTSGAKPLVPEDFARNLVLRIADELRLHIAGRTSEVRVKLKPEYLGELSLRVTMQDGELAARMEVSAPAVKAALDAQLPQLRDSLASLGIEMRRFEIVADGGLQQRMPHDQHRFQHRQGSRRQTDVEVAETYVSTRNLGYNTVEYII